MNISFKNDNIPDISRYNDNVVNNDSTKKTVLKDSLNVAIIDSMIYIGAGLTSNAKFDKKDTIKFLDKNFKFRELK